MKTTIAVILSLITTVVLANPFIVSDSIDDSRITHCAWYIDTLPKQILPVARDAANKPYCSRDMLDATVGAHSLKAAFVAKDAVWGDKEGALSAPFSYTVPSSTSAVPAALKLIAK
jgi:hypothetical protein